MQQFWINHARQFFRVPPISSKNISDHHYWHTTLSKCSTSCMLLWLSLSKVATESCVFSTSRLRAVMMFSMICSLCWRAWTCCPTSSSAWSSWRLSAMSFTPPSPPSVSKSAVDWEQMEGELWPWRSKSRPGKCTLLSGGKGTEVRTSLKACRRSWRWTAELELSCSRTFSKFP